MTGRETLTTGNKMKKLTTPTTKASAAAERTIRIHRLMNCGVSQQVATQVIDRDNEVRAKMSASINGPKCLVLNLKGHLEWSIMRYKTNGKQNY